MLPMAIRLRGMLFLSRSSEKRLMRVPARILLLFACPLVFAQVYPIAQSGQSSTRIDVDAQANHLHGTVIVGMALSEGLVLAGDSRLTLISAAGQFPGYKVISDNNSKVFQIDNFGAATYGEAFLKNRTISSWIEDYKHAPDKSSDIDTFSAKFSKYFDGIYKDAFKDPKIQPVIGFLLAGYDSKGAEKLLRVEFPSQAVPKEVKNTHDLQGAEWSGQTDVIERLILGYDARIATLPSLGTLSDEQKKQFVQQIIGLQYDIPWNSLMLQDGIDLANSLVKTTVNLQRFAFGTIGNVGDIPAVGGSVDVLVITPAGVQWVKKKALTSE
jgi:hypothetical protein